MCNIAGYTGTRRAAPILIDMIRREQFIDGGLSTGIATIHEGKVYSAKILGDVDELLRTTDALNFPGTCGIIHSRPGGDFLSHAHPFLSEDKDCAVVLNGTLRDIACPEFFLTILCSRFMIVEPYVPPTKIQMAIIRIIWITDFPTTTLRFTR